MIDASSHLQRLTNRIRAVRFPKLKFARRAFIQIAEKIQFGFVNLEFPDGEVIRLGQHSADLPMVNLQFHSERAFIHLLAFGPLGMAKSYLAGEWSCSDLTTLFRILLLNRDATKALYATGSPLLKIIRARHEAHDHTRKDIEKSNKFHYGLGARFFSEWLDPTLTYSSAYKFDEGISLHEAQLRKYANTINNLGAKPGASILDLGCGWGGFAKFAATHSCRVHGITLSKDQLDHATVTTAGHGLEEKVSFEQLDYRDTDGTYDHVISIEMIETLGEENWETYFQAIYDRLKPGGTAVIQAIVIADMYFEDYSNRIDFVQDRMFPGSHLPSPRNIILSARAAGLKLERKEYFAKDYAKTLAAWRANFDHQWPHIKALGCDERFRRMWTYFFCYCEAGFLEKTINVGLFKFRRPTEPEEQIQVTQK